jgi:Lamin Tail Domain
VNTRLKTVLHALLMLCLSSASTLTFALSNSLVISQIYGGGGNIGAPLNSDFVEIFNRGNAPITLTNWSLQYAPPLSAAWVVIPLSGTVAPGQYYLIKLGNGGLAGAALPTPDLATLTPPNINAISGKVALVNNLTALTVINPLVPLLPSIVDLVGYGTLLTVNAYETAPASTLSNTTANSRAAGGCTETDNNSLNFTLLTLPNPRNSLSPINLCGPLLSVKKVMAVLCDPVNGTVNPVIIPGAVVQWTVTVSNTGVASGMLNQLADPISVLTPFDANLITGAGGAAGCRIAVPPGTPESAAGRGFNLNVLGDTRPGIYPKYLTSSNVDADGGAFNTNNVLIDYVLAMPIETGYLAGELKPGEAVVIYFNVTIN